MSRSCPRPCRWYAVAIAAVVAGCNSAPPPEEAPDLSPPLEQSSDQPPPALEFPASARTEDASLNTFIEQVFEVCRVGRYEDYRLLHSRYVQPLRRDSFKEYWERVGAITVQAVVPLPRVEDDTDPDQPAWMVTAHVSFEPGCDPLERQLRFVISREADRWVLGRGPASATQPQTEMGTSPG